MSPLLERSLLLRQSSQALNLRATSAVANGRAACRHSGSVRRRLDGLRALAQHARRASLALRPPGR